MKKKLWVKLISLVAVSALLMPFVSAHCPLCTATAGLGIGIARLYGVDDSIVGLFLGAFIASSALWFNKWLINKRIVFPFQEPLILLSSFLMMNLPLYLSGIINSFQVVKSAPREYSLLGVGVLGIDKLLFGAIIGTFIIWLTFRISDLIKSKRKGKVLWPYQTPSFMLIVLLFFLILLWFTAK